MTDRAYRLSIEIDWERAVSLSHLRKFVQRYDRDDDAEDEQDEILEIGRAFVERAALVYDLFGYYSSVPDGTGDISSIAQMGYRQLVADFTLDRQHSKHASMANLDTVFITSDTAVPAASKGGRKEAFNRKRALNRQEFLRLLVGIAVARHVLCTPITKDVSEAVIEVRARSFLYRILLRT